MTLNEARCVLMASVMRADGVIHLEEIALGMQVSGALALEDRRAGADDWQRSISMRDHVDLAIARLRHEWRDERERVIDFLWQMATCDRELHPAEAAVITDYASRLMADEA